MPTVVYESRPLWIDFIWTKLRNFYIATVIQLMLKNVVYAVINYLQMLGLRPQVHQ